MRFADVTETAGNHNWLVVPAQLATIVAGNHLFVCTEVAKNIRSAKFVIKCSATQWAFEHDIQRSDNTIRLAEILFPRLLKARNTQVTHGKSDQTGFWLSTDSCGAFVTNFTT